ncbi:MAG: hypothetical protein KDA92_11350 [Planctomycetales bacterium]|nr:hypothetical protein [Planctomycetales bacterium]
MAHPANSHLTTDRQNWYAVSCESAVSCELDSADGVSCESAGPVIGALSVDGSAAADSSRAGAGKTMGTSA